MSTGYTVILKNGGSVKEFMLACVRAFGPPLEELDPSNAYEQQLQWAKERLARLTERSREEGQKAWEERRAIAREDYKRCEKEKEETRNRYMAAREKIAQLPLDGDHAGYKAFMLKQIDESIDWDCPVSPPFSFPDYLTWVGQEQELLQRKVKYCIQALEGCRERVGNAGKWIQVVRDVANTVED